MLPKKIILLNILVTFMFTSNLSYQTLNSRSNNRFFFQTESQKSTFLKQATVCSSFLFGILKLFFTGEHFTTDDESVLSSMVLHPLNG